MYAVIGAASRTGEATAEALLKQGEKVRALVHREHQLEPWTHRHAEAQVVDLSDTAALTRAFTGVRGAYLLLPPNPAAEDFLADRAAFFGHVVAAVKAAKLERVVFLSSVGAQHPAGTGPVVALHQAEVALKGAAPSVTVLRAASFVENWAGLALTALDTGELPHFGSVHTRFPQVCARDLGEVAARALIEGTKGARVLEVAGPENWSVEEVAEVLSSILAADVKAVAHPPEEARAAALAEGASPSYAALMVELYQAMGQGRLVFSHPHQVLRGHTGLYEALKPLL